jgi:hypothetical protein
MFTLTASRQGTTCDGTSRRDFLRIGSLGLGSLALPSLLRARSSEPSLSRSPSVIWLWLGGGAPHIETFDPKMSEAVEYRSVTGSVKSSLPGIDLGGNFEQTAIRADKFAFVRSFSHTNSGHGGGTHWVMTGHDYPAADNGADPNRPGLGAILSRYRGPSAASGLPNYIRFRTILGDGPSWLGQPYSPFDVNGKARENMVLRGSLDRLEDRKSLLKQFDTLDRSLDQSGLMNGLDSFEAQAYDLIMSRSKQIFSIEEESLKLRERYGKGLGEQLLLARRLAENGVGFVTIHSGGWDMHGSLKTGMDRLGPTVDQAISSFVDDCAVRGLDRDILLVITGEFGRTPKLNTAGGRDHWPLLSTLAFAGGGLRMGQVIGESSQRAETPKSRPITPQDLMATLFHYLHLPQDLQYQDQSGRPIPMIDGGKVIHELL